MFFHKQELQYNASPAKPDEFLARKMQELLGGQYGEISVAPRPALRHRGGGARPRRDARDHDRPAAREGTGRHDRGRREERPGRGRGRRGHGRAARDRRRRGCPCGRQQREPLAGHYITASGNLLAGFTANANAEMQGRVQAARVFHMTEDKGVRDMLSFFIARDHMHQNQWIAAAAELRAEGYEDLPVPSNFPIKKEDRDVSYQYINFSDGAAAAEGSWASGPTPDGKGEFSYLAQPEAGVPMPPPTHPDSRLYGTTELPNIVEKAAGAIQDKLKKE